MSAPCIVVRKIREEFIVEAQEGAGIRWMTQAVKLISNRARNL